MNALDRLGKKRRKVSENQDIEDRLGKLIIEVGEKVNYFFAISK